MCCRGEDSVRQNHEFEGVMLNIVSVYALQVGYQK